jgi:UDP-N-acetylmuramoyl-tripeptide--D-alanyl-D-alanine ligase
MTLPTNAPMSSPASDPGGSPAGSPMSSPIGSPTGAPMATLGQALALLQAGGCAATRVGAADIAFRRVHSDTRTLQPGDLFVALRGDNFDAHDFLPQARAAGAAAAIAERGLGADGHAGQLPGLHVPDALAALQALATAWRAQLELPLIAITGSNGKTTVTQMTAAILRAWRGEAAFATVGNLNNHIGLPLTLLRLRQDNTAWHSVGVVELGMNHSGEIAMLARMAAPSVVVVNNAQREHQEFMHTVEAVAHENGSAIEAMAATGVAVYPADDAQAPVWHALAGERPQLSFALTGPADVTADAGWVGDHWDVVLHTPGGSTSLALHTPGRHNLHNALAAATGALAAGAPLEAIALGLGRFRPVQGRSHLRTLQRGGRSVTLIDDSYNANPDSMRAAIDVLATQGGTRWLVLGDMGEVGDRGPEFHAEVGAHAAACGIDHLWAAGGESAAAAAAYGASARHYPDVDALLAALPTAPDCDAVLVKGSRFMRMERVVRALADASTLSAAPSVPPASGGRDAA